MPRILAVQTLHSCLPAMYRTVIHYPKHTTGVVIGWPRHHLFDQTIKRHDAILGLTPTENSSIVDIQSTEVNPSSTAFVSVLDAARATGLTGFGRMDAATGLNAGLFIGGDHEFIGLQRLALPLAAIQIQQATSLFGKVWILREDPTTVIPRADSVLMQPAPKRTAADGSDKAGLAELPRQVRCAPT